jgi:hypothetical protein
MGNEVVVRADTMPAKIQYAKALADSGLLPANYRQQPANVLYAIEYGEMLGLAPMAAITGIHVIEGKPTASAGLIASLVRRAGHRLRVSGDAKRAVVEIVRADDPEFTFRSEWTIERAIEASLVEIKNGKLWSRDTKGRPKPWERYPAAMLKARAISECARDACEEALSGVHYTPEEMGADVNADGEPIQVAAERVETPAPQQEIDWDAELAERAGNVEALKDLYKMAAGIYGNSNPELAERIAAAGKAAAEPAEPDTVAEKSTEEAPTEPVDAEVVEEPDAEPVQEINAATRAQLTKLTVSLSDLAVKEQGDVHATLSKLVQRPISSRKDLTRDEATQVIELLERCLKGAEPLRKFDAVLASLNEVTP